MFSKSLNPIKKIPSRRLGMLSLLVVNPFCAQIFNMPYNTKNNLNASLTYTTQNATYFDLIFI